MIANKCGFWGTSLLLLFKQYAGSHFEHLPGSLQARQLDISHDIHAGAPVGGQKVEGEQRLFA